MWMTRLAMINHVSTNYTTPVLNVTFHYCKLQNVSFKLCISSEYFIVADNKLIKEILLSDAGLVTYSKFVYQIWFGQVPPPTQSDSLCTSISD